MFTQIQVFMNRTKRVQRKQILFTKNYSDYHTFDILYISIYCIYSLLLHILQFPINT